MKALVLAGGGAKGSYQVGVWRALEELGWKPDIITGTSVGSLNGALFTLGLTDVARDMWLQIDTDDIITLPDRLTPGELHDFLRDVVKGGGLDVTPLEQIIDRLLDEQALRASPIKFGLVTVERSKENGIRPRELTIDEIPEGKVKDYLLASAACFPAFRPRQIDGAKFYDGGYADNLPFGLAKRMGADELLCVDIDGLGVKKLNFSGLPTKTIESHWDLGELLKFDPATARRNIELGYYDTLRTFGRVQGTAYAIRLGKSQTEALNAFRAKYDAVLDRVTEEAPALSLTALTAVQLFGPGKEQRALAPLELAAEQAGVDPTVLYSAEELCAAFAAAYDPEQAERYRRVLNGEEKTGMEKAFAAVTPRDFVAAVVYTALNQP